MPDASWNVSSVGSLIGRANGTEETRASAHVLILAWTSILRFMGMSVEKRFLRVFFENVAAILTMLRCSIALDSGKQSDTLRPEGKN